MTLKYIIKIIIFSLLSIQCISQNENASLMCLSLKKTYEINKVWEYDNGVVLFVKDTIHFDNKIFYEWTSGNSWTRFYSNDEDGNFYMLSRKKDKCVLIIPKEEIFNYESPLLDDLKLKILSYHASIVTPFCKYEDVIIIEDTFEGMITYFKKGIGFLARDLKGIRLNSLQSIYFEKPEKVFKKG